MFSGQELREHDAFALALVREHRRTRDVADRVDPLRRRLHLLVDLDEAAFSELDAGFLESDVFDVGRTAGRDENDVALHLLLLTAGFDRQRNGILRGFDVRYLRAREDGDAAFLER